MHDPVSNAIKDRYAHPSIAAKMEMHVVICLRVAAEADDGTIQ
jgi:hypothetical protein